jgi:crossover junction endodeoxyribonuclease RusA
VADYVLHIPAPDEWLNSNQRLHWARRAKLTKAWRQAACWRAIAVKLPLGLSRVSIVAAVHRTDNRRADAANRYPTVKAAIDGVVDAGVILDDSDRYVKGVLIQAGEPIRFAGQRWGRLTLTITEEA